MYALGWRHSGILALSIRLAFRLTRILSRPCRYCFVFCLRNIRYNIYFARMTSQGPFRKQREREDDKIKKPKSYHSPTTLYIGSYGSCDSSSASSTAPMVVRLLSSSCSDENPSLTIPVSGGSCSSSRSFFDPLIDRLRNSFC